MKLPALPQIPGIPDPMRRIRVPTDLDSVTSVGLEEHVGGLSADSVERIWSAAVGVYRSGMHPAVQVCVRHRGAVVLNRAIGHARGNGPREPGHARGNGPRDPGRAHGSGPRDPGRARGSGPRDPGRARGSSPRDPGDPEAVAATPDTPIVIYSGAKAITATLVHRLHERGLLDIGDPVAAYIPGYGRHGKGAITIGHVLAHRAGVPNLVREALELDRMADSEFIAQTLVDAKPSTRAGRALAYHAVSGGFILGEVVRRATGEDIREALAREILRPLRFRWTNYGVAEADLGAVALNYVTGPPTAPPFSQLLTRALGLGLGELVAASNDRRFLTAIIPSANIVTTAFELSRFYELLRRGGELDGVRVLTPQTIRHAMTQQSHLEIDLSLGFPTRFGYGYMLGSRLLSLYGRDTQHAFGHLGFTNILSWADPQRALACAVITTGKPILYPELPRFYGLMQRITETMPKVPSDEMAVWDPTAGRPGVRP